MTQHEIIFNYLKFLYAKDENNGWVVAYKLRGLDTPYGFIGDAVDVRLRELRKAGKVESRKNGRFEEYRIVPAAVEYNPTVLFA